MWHITESEVSSYQLREYETPCWRRPYGLPHRLAHRQVHWPKATVVANLWVGPCMEEEDRKVFRIAIHGTLSKWSGAQIARFLHGNGSVSATGSVEPAA